MDIWCGRLSNWITCWITCDGKGLVIRYWEETLQSFAKSPVEEWWWDDWWWSEDDDDDARAEDSEQLCQELATLLGFEDEEDATEEAPCDEPIICWAKGSKTSGKESVKTQYSSSLGIIITITCVSVFQTTTPILCFSVVSLQVCMLHSRQLLFLLMIPISCMTSCPWDEESKNESNTLETQYLRHSQDNTVSHCKTKHDGLWKKERNSEEEPWGWFHEGFHEGFHEENCDSFCFSCVLCLIQLQFPQLLLKSLICVCPASVLSKRVTCIIFRTETSCRFFAVNSSSFFSTQSLIRLLFSILASFLEYVIWFGIKSSKGCNQNNQNAIHDTINTNQVECNACLISRYPDS